MRQLPGGRLFVAPRCGHEVMVRRPALFNEALAGFYRSTEDEARKRAEAGASAAPGPEPEAALAHVAAPADESDDRAAVSDLAWLDRPDQ
jgi:hypothetical protein